jgi:hypothetical protein
VINGFSYKDCRNDLPDATRTSVTDCLAARHRASLVCGEQNKGARMLRAN